MDKHSSSHRSSHGLSVGTIVALKVRSMIEYSVDEEVNDMYSFQSQWRVNQLQELKSYRC